MPLINCKAELTPKWTKVFCLSAAGNDNDNDNNIISAIKDTKNICSCSNPISKRQPKIIKTS